MIGVPTRLRFAEARNQPPIQVQNRAPELVPAAVFIRGNGPADWLPELAGFSACANELRLAVVPTSIADLTPAGVLVIPPDGTPLPPASCRLHRYGCLAGKLYLPIDSTLEPAFSEAELRARLLWHCQLYHPVIGFIGFDAADLITLAKLLEPPPQRPADWRFASPGLPPAPALTVVRMPEPSLDQMMQGAGSGIGSEQLEDIPRPPGESSGLSDNVRHLERDVVRGLRSLTSKLKDILRARMQKQSPSSSQQQPPRSEEPGMIDKAHQWLGKRLDQLNDIRSREVDRLLGMLDRDPDEALKYAIPLSGPYANRGQAPPSPYLSAKPVQFDLGRLGGGSAVDSWSIDDSSYHQLRSKYLATANRELAMGRYQRAAYIYAHLLGDYHAAANALKQGHYYREAAILYRDHLRRPLAAAACLERGGLVQEAIDLYVEADQFEKAADLYQQIDRPDKAAIYYQHAVAQHVGERGDYLGAAAIQERKLQDPASALETLRAGWPQSGQAVKCLKSYFHLQGRLGLHQESARDLREVTEAPMGVSEVQSLVTVLADVQARHPYRPLRELSADQATTLIGNHVAGLDDPDQARNLLRKLGLFAPDDRLLTRDCMRYVDKLQRPEPKHVTPQPASGIVRAPVSSFRLLEVVECYTVQPCRNGYVALARAGRELIAIRGDWHRSRSVRWSLPASSTDRLRLVADDRVARWALILAGPRDRLRLKSLPATETFPHPLVMGTPDWMPDNALVASSSEIDHFVVLQRDSSGLLLGTYSSAGELLSERVLELDEAQRLGPPQLQIRRGDTYLCLGTSLWRVGTDHVHSLELPGNALICQASAHYSTLRIAVATDNGCLITWPDSKGIDSTSEHFARDLHVTAMAFLPGGHLVVAGEQEARVYSTRQRKLRYECDVHVEGITVGIVPQGTGNDFALFNKDGNVSIYRLT